MYSICSKVTVPVSHFWPNKWLIKTIVITTTNNCYKIMLTIEVEDNMQRTQTLYIIHHNNIIIEKLQNFTKWYILTG